MNSELARAAEARVHYYVSIGSSREFMWRKALEALLAVAKDIRRLPCGRIVNMPKLRETTARQELEAIVRGEKLPVPPEMLAAANSGTERDFASHPYLRRMAYRGGGYAILMALHLRSTRPTLRQFMYKAELVKEAQAFCDDSMVSDGWSRSSSCGWASHRSLLAHRLLAIVRSSTGAEEFSLTDDGRKLLAEMLVKWPRADLKKQSIGHTLAGGLAQTRPLEGGLLLERAPKRRRRWAAGRLLQRAASPAAADEPPRIDFSAKAEENSEALLPAAAEPPSTNLSAKTEGSSKEFLEISSSEDEETHEQPAVRILVDDRERLRDAQPRGLLDRIRVAVDGSKGIKAAFRRLRFGDYAWVCGEVGQAQEDCEVMGVVIERKRVADLVGRSATGAHVRQLQDLETCGLEHPFLLLEGDPRRAESCPVYDDEHRAEVEAVGDVIRDEEGINELCARLLVVSGRVGFLSTRDATGTARLLGLLSEWLQWHRRCGPSGLDEVARAPETLREFEAKAALRAKQREALAGSLLSSGVPAPAAEVVCRRFGSVSAACTVLRTCASLEHRLRLFDFDAACAQLSPDICTALGGADAASEEVAQAPPLRRRRARIAASPALARRLGTVDVVASGIVVEASPCLWDDEGASCCGEISVRAPLAIDCERGSASIVVVVVPGSWLVRGVVAAAVELGTSAPAPALARTSALALAGRLRSLRRSAKGSVHLAVIEGLRAAVLATARGNDPSLATLGTDARGALLARLLGLVELAALALDLAAGWRVRLHDVQAAETTTRFVKVLARVAREEMLLPFWG